MTLTFPRRIRTDSARSTSRAFPSRSVWVLWEVSQKLRHELAELNMTGPITTIIPLSDNTRSCTIPALRITLEGFSQHSGGCRGTNI